MHGALKVTQELMAVDVVHAFLQVISISPDEGIYLQRNTKINIAKRWTILSIPEYISVMRRGGKKYDLLHR